MAFEQSEQTGLVLTNLTVPAGVLADVCLPTALLVHGRGGSSVLLVNGKAVASARPERGQLCVAAQLGGGSFTIQSSS